MTALFTAFTSAGTILHIGDASLQTMFSCLAGILLGPLCGAVSQALYVLLGLIGLPVFAYGGGLSYVLQPTFGYLLGMIFCAFLTGLLAERTRWSLWIVSTIGLLSVYLIGTPFFYFIARYVDGVPWRFNEAFIVSCLYFLPFDAVKLLVCATLGRRLLPVVRKDLYES
ncbi:MAG: biotin transporter BioY [Oscillospiraceae bacterium]|nr:biotin transporter BioY [Oscillospiraceae bacterium]